MVCLITFQVSLPFPKTWWTRYQVDMFCKTKVLGRRSIWRARLVKLMGAQNWASWNDDVNNVPIFQLSIFHFCIISILRNKAFNTHCSENNCRKQGNYLKGWSVLELYAEFLSLVDVLPEVIEVEKSTAWLGGWTKQYGFTFGKYSRRPSLNTVGVKESL